jgi:hypothetical protein
LAFETSEREVGGTNPPTHRCDPVCSVAEIELGVERVSEIQANLDSTGS